MRTLDKRPACAGLRGSWLAFHGLPSRREKTISRADDVRRSATSHPAALTVEMMPRTASEPARGTYCRVVEALARATLNCFEVPRHPSGGRFESHASTRAWKRCSAKFSRSPILISLMTKVSLHDQQSFPMWPCREQVAGGTREGGGYPLFSFPRHFARGLPCGLRSPIPRDRTGILVPTSECGTVEQLRAFPV